VTQRHAAIVGAGIAGLTSALALARKGFTVSIYEQAVELAEVGAGLQLSPNATRLLDRLGLVEKLTDKWHEPPSIDLVSGLSGRHVAQVPAGAKARKRWGAPYAVIHRADLQSVLHQAVLDHPSIELQLGVRIEGAGVEAVRRDIEARSGRLPDLVVGADGVWSRMRASAGGPAKAPFTGQIAWRMTLPRDFSG
jgi:salicylate hydroxylase